MVARNLLDDLPAELDEAELRWVLQSRLGTPAIPSRKKLLYPSAAKYVLSLNYSGHALTRIERGPGFSSDTFAELQAEIQTTLVDGSREIARAILFSSPRPVLGYFRDAEGVLQIQPPPAEAPTLGMMQAAHPFVLEFPVRRSSDAFVTNMRRLRGLLEHSWVLNALLRDWITASDTVRPIHHWVEPPASLGVGTAPVWAQRSYFVPDFKPYASDFSPLGTPNVTLVPESDYYRHEHPPIASEVVLPDSLSTLLTAFAGLSSEDRRRFLRASHWTQTANNLCDDHTSSWFTALITAIETLGPGRAGRGALRGSANGVTKAFVDFVETYSPESTRKTRDAIYATRSAITHGSRLLHLDDAPWDSAFDRTHLEEADARSDVATVAGDVLVNWLRTTSATIPRQQPFSHAWRAAGIAKKPPLLASRVWILVVTMATAVLARAVRGHRDGKRSS